jgi:hypothetical protein
MKLIGQQFTKRSGIFRVYDASSAMREAIFHMPLRVSFGEGSPPPLPPLCAAASYLHDCLAGWCGLSRGRGRGGREGRAKPAAHHLHAHEGQLPGRVRDQLGRRLHLGLRHRPPPPAGTTPSSFIIVIILLLSILIIIPFIYLCYFYLFHVIFQEIRQQIPARVKTPWNLVFIFPFFLVGLLFRRPAPSQLLRVRAIVSRW